MRYAVIISLLFCMPMKGHSQITGFEEHVTHIITLFKQNDIEKISELVQYPLKRASPVPNIDNKKEFIHRFDEVFDKELKERITTSRINQWSKTGSRGTAFEQGVLWLDENGWITAVNHQSEYENKLKLKLINEEREMLHSSLKIFQNPVYSIRTKNYFIRIDELSNNKYRYASWKNGITSSEPPDLILTNGRMEFTGSGGNHTLTFSNKNYIYTIYRNMIGSDETAEIVLEIEKDGKIILSENGILSK